MRLNHQAIFGMYGVGGMAALGVERVATDLFPEGGRAFVFLGFLCLAIGPIIFASICSSKIETPVPCSIEPADDGPYVVSGPITHEARPEDLAAILPVDPDAHYWQGPCECSICGHEQQNVVPIAREHNEPICPLECAWCGNMTSNPNDR